MKNTTINIQSALGMVKDDAVFLQPTYHNLGQKESAAFINLHALTGDTTGHIQGKERMGCFASLPQLSPIILIELSWSS